MSQSRVFVQALDGLLYSDPLIVGSDWFVCFCDDEPPEIVMKRSSNTTEKSARRKAHMALTEAGLGFELGEVNSLKDGRSFPPSWKAKPASSIFFKLLAPIPVPRSYGGVKIEPARVNATMYIFWHDFDTRVILESILGISVDAFLVSAAVPWGRLPSDATAYVLRKVLRKAVEDQWPELKNVTVENYEELLLSQPKQMRIKWQSLNATEGSGI